MSYLRYLCLFAYSGVFLFCFPSSSVPYIVSFFLDCPILIAPSVLSNMYFII
jgi:hypothetical protein